MGSKNKVGGQKNKVGGQKNKGGVKKTRWGVKKTRCPEHGGHPVARSGVLGAVVIFDGYPLVI